MISLCLLLCLIISSVSFLMYLVRPTHWKQDLLLLDAPIQVEKGQRLKGSVLLKRHKLWRRHLRIKLNYSLWEDGTELNEVMHIHPLSLCLFVCLSFSVSLSVFLFLSLSLSLSTKCSHVLDFFTCTCTAGVSLDDPFVSSNACISKVCFFF